jgi:hypothetical protein
MFWKDIRDDVGVCEEGFRQRLYCLNKQNISMVLIILKMDNPRNFDSGPCEPIETHIC